jgi:uncharacterized cofD-like protein
MQAISGNIERALRESSRVLAVRGQILPSTLEDIQLGAEYADGQTALGESQLPQVRKPIKRIFLRPAHPPAYPEAIKAILDADMIVIGPGSLYTSIMPNLLVADIARAVRAANAIKVYVCNVATQSGETDNYVVHDHVRTLDRHAGPNLFQYVVVNNNTTIQGNVGPDSVLVRVNGALAETDYQLWPADVVDVDHPHFHDANKLAETLIRLYNDRSTTRSESPDDAAELVASR